MLFHGEGYPGVKFYATSNNNSNEAPSSNNGAYNAWNHVCTTRTTAGLATFYVNGAQSGTAGVNSGTPSAGGTVTIGANASGNYTYRGKIDDVRVYNRILTTGEITQVYNLGSGINDTANPTVSITAPAGGASITGSAGSISGSFIKVRQ